jgi:predicted nucleic acid-binding protein
MIVVDASAVLELLLRTPTAAAVENYLFSPRQTLHAPHLIDVEVAQVLRRYAASGALNSERGRDALTDLRDLSITRYPHDILLPRVWELRENLTSYDAVYVALAEGLNAPLLTCDQRLANAPGHEAQIELVQS